MRSITILPNNVLRLDVAYTSSTNLSLWTLCSDKTLSTSLQPIYSSNENKIKRTVHRSIDSEHRIDAKKQGIERVYSDLALKD